MDGGFIIEDTIDEPASSSDSFSMVRLTASENTIRTLIYNSDEQFSVITYEDGQKINQGSRKFDHLAMNFIHPVMVGDKAYLAVLYHDKSAGRSSVVFMLEISLDSQSYLSGQTTAVVTSPKGLADWVIPVAVAAPVVAVVSIITIILVAKNKGRSLRLQGDMEMQGMALLE
ncbi:hypothetical protein [Endozoicomonas lisbonensis]|uniref:Uncharacterized protein n=1 Tax=Endozoicomonas lisbonensis TaxID=3120522 RepID=A0ABV2SJM3_9GAMM